MSKLTKDQIRANRIKWLEALESGEYEQVNGEGLRVETLAGPRYCCLGVAAELFTPGEWDGPIRQMSDGRFINEDADVCHDYLDFEETSTDGSPIVALGMNEDDQWDCIYWNDGSGSADAVPLTFFQIAAKMRGRWRLPKEG